MDPVATTMPAEQTDKQLHNSSKRGVNKFLKQFRNLNWVKKLQSPKPDNKKNLDNSCVSISNPNALYEFEESDRTSPNVPIFAADSDCRPLCLPTYNGESSALSNRIRHIDGWQLTTFPRSSNDSDQEDSLRGFSHESSRLNQYSFRSDLNSLSANGGLFH
ncbi:hypothetical protein Aperf_G00000055730 [Anoplocephala perfoliata]